MVHATCIAIAQRVWQITQSRLLKKKIRPKHYLDLLRAVAQFANAAGACALLRQQQATTPIAKTGIKPRAVAQKRLIDGMIRRAVKRGYLVPDQRAARERFADKAVDDLTEKIKRRAVAERRFLNSPHVWHDPDFWYTLSDVEGWAAIADYTLRLIAGTNTQRGMPLPVEFNLPAKFRSDNNDDGRFSSDTIIQMARDEAWRIRVCLICDAIFVAKRLDQKACRLQCANALRVREWKKHRKQYEQTRRKLAESARKHRSSRLKSKT